MTLFSMPVLPVLWHDTQGLDSDSLSLRPSIVRIMGMRITISAEFARPESLDKSRPQFDDQPECSKLMETPGHLLAIWLIT